MIKNNQKYVSRELFEELKKWIDRREIFAIKGPRQVGKTTLLKMLRDWLISEKNVPEQNVIFITFEDRETLEQFKNGPKEYVRSRIRGNTEEKFYFFIDEFQYLADGGQILKLLYDTMENIKFIITGSSSLELTSKTAKFLVGRIFSFHLWQFDFSEFLKVRSEEMWHAYKEKSTLVRDFLSDGTDPKLPESDVFGKELQSLFEQYALWGGYPESVKSDTPEERLAVLKNIYESYVERDIIELLRVRDYGQFKKLVSLLASQIGNLANYENIAKDIQSHFKELKRYLSILEETFVISELRPYFANKSSELKKNPKIYFVDTGLRNYCLGGVDRLEHRPDTGALVENIIFSQLLRDEGKPTFYWRTTGGAEVDFVVKTKNGLIPIEIKYSPFKKPSVPRGLRSFIASYAPARAIVTTKNFWGKAFVGNTTVLFVPVWYVS